MKSKKILFIDTVHPILQEILEEHGMKCIDATTWNEQEVISQIGEYNGVVIRSRFKIGKALIEKAHNLEFIARAGAGMENIEEAIAEEKGVICLNAPEGNRNAVAEHALGMLLALFNNLLKSDKEVRDEIWRREENRGIELDGKTVGIIGFGNTGQAFARKLKGFELTILVYDPYITIDSSTFPNVIQSDLNRLKKECDVVSFHVPLSEETSGMGNRIFFGDFSKPIFVINTSRGKVVNISDLVEALEKGKVKGAALDVLEFESVSFENLSKSNLPESFQKLIKFENVILSPHIAGWTFESHRKISEVLAEKIIGFYSKQK